MSNIESTVDWIMCGIYACAGQVCSANSRLLVHEDCADDILELLKAKTEQVAVGNPFDESTQMGPLVSKEQHQKVHNAIGKAVAEGCTALAGGSTPEFEDQSLQGGYFVEPTILVGLPEKASAWDEEIFGPVGFCRLYHMNALNVGCMCRYCRCVYSRLKKKLLRWQMPQIMGWQMQ